MPVNHAHPFAAGAVTLSNLGAVDLREFYADWFNAAIARCGGASPYQNRMKFELREFLALAQISRGRIEPLAATFEGDFQLHFILRTPVPMKNAGDEVVLFDWAQIHLRYPEEALRQALPGTTFVRVVKPARVFHPNVSEIEPGIPAQILCLGASIPPATRLRELVVISYHTLTLQSATLDLFDPAGVLNSRAAVYWQAARERIPLTNEPFLVNPGPATPQPAAKCLPRCRGCYPDRLFSTLFRFDAAEW